MKQANFLNSKFMACVFFALAVCGCLSVPDSPDPKFYMLRAIDESRVTHKFSITPGKIIGIGPVKIPEYLNRPQIVTRDSNNMLIFAQFDRWGESLDVGIGRLIRENLIIMLPGATLETFPWGLDVPVKYQVFIDIVQLEGELAEDLILSVQWSVFDIDKKKMAIIKRTEFRQAISPHNYSGLVKTLSAACASLSSEIAGELESLGALPEEKEEIPAAKQNTF